MESSNRNYLKQLFQHNQIQDTLIWYILRNNRRKYQKSLSTIIKPLCVHKSGKFCICNNKYTAFHNITLGWGVHFWCVVQQSVRCKVSMLYLENKGFHKVSQCSVGEYCWKHVDSLGIWLLSNFGHCMFRNLTVVEIFMNPIFSYMKCLKTLRAHSLRQSIANWLTIYGRFIEFVCGRY